MSLCAGDLAGLLIQTVSQTEEVSGEILVNALNVFTQTGW
jgi:hypothetical protein